MTDQTQTNLSEISDVNELHRMYFEFSENLFAARQSVELNNQNLLATRQRILQLDGSAKVYTQPGDGAGDAEA